MDVGFLYERDRGGRQFSNRTRLTYVFEVPLNTHISSSNQWKINEILRDTLRSSFSERVSIFFEVRMMRLGVQVLTTTE